MQDALVDQELSVAHAWHFLAEVDRVELQVVTRLTFDPDRAIATDSVATPRLHEELLIQRAHLDLDEVLDVLCITELLLVVGIALLVLAEKRLRVVGADRPENLLLDDL